MNEFKKVSNVLLESNGIYFIECPGVKPWIHSMLIQNTKFAGTSMAI